jgi:hypothetical protein
MVNSPLGAAAAVCSMQQTPLFFLTLDAFIFWLGGIVLKLGKNWHDCLLSWWINRCGY